MSEIQDFRLMPFGKFRSMDVWNTKASEDIEKSYTTLTTVMIKVKPFFNYLPGFEEYPLDVAGLIIEFKMN